MLFSAEDTATEHSVVLPEDVLKVLRRDEQIVRTLKAEEKSADELTTESFLASEVHLDGPSEVDLVVIGEGRLRGANVVTFWVFRKSGQGYALVLKTTAHDLKIQTARWKGFRNIETASLIAGIAQVDIFRFDGTQYRHYRSKSKPIS